MKHSLLKSAFLLAAVVLAACSPVAMRNSLAGSALATQSETAQTNAVVASALGSESSSVLKQIVDSSTLEEIYLRVNPSVVNIQVVTQSQSTNFAPGFPFGDQQEMPSPQSSALGSGFVWDTQGHIVTNNHVVENGTEISVMFSDGFVVPATIVGTDSNSDLAVLKVDMPANRLAPLSLAPSADVRVGQAAIAIGNPFGLEGTMTLGIISAVGRSLPVEAGISTGGGNYTIPNIIQTDAPINPGNSGGVLLNDEGQVIGVTNAIESTTRANAGIGFAIPSAIIEKVVPALIADGTYEYPYIGISGTTLSYNLNKAMNLSEDQRGVLVAQVTSGGPAETAGLLGSDQQAQVNGGDTAVGGDIIVGIDGNKINTFEDMVGYLIEKKSPGDTALLDILRDGKNVEVTMTLGTRPAQP